MPFPFRRVFRTGPWLAGAEVGLGIVLAVTPVALWVAWTPSLLLAVLAAAVISAVLLGLLHGRGENADVRQQAASSPPVLPDGFVEEIHQIFPLTYHHSRTGSARFRRAMQHLRQRLW